jgi:hypothetical protein
MVKGATDIGEYLDKKKRKEQKYVRKEWWEHSVLFDSKISSKGNGMARIENKRSNQSYL